MSKQKEFNLSDDGSIRFKIDGRTLLEVSDRFVSYKGEVLIDDKDIAKSFMEFIETMKERRTANEVLFALEGNKEKVSTLERRIRELEVVNMKKGLEILAAEKELSILRGKHVSVSLKTTGTTDATPWYAQC